MIKYGKKYWKVEIAYTLSRDIPRKVVGVEMSCGNSSLRVNKVLRVR
jgi:hypothetical protein